MNRLYLKQSTVSADQYQVDLQYQAEKQPLRTAGARFRFALSRQDQEDLRWYLEDYLLFPFDPAPGVAARVETRMTQIGNELFAALFQQADDVRDLWAQLRNDLNDTRVEIITGVQEAASIPWELLRDPRTDTPLALNAQAFVRSHTNAVVAPHLPAHSSGPIRILLVICRPGGRSDVPFRSVASRLLKGLSDEARAQFQLDVLRPPTFEQLARTLRQAKAEEHPYHVVHFDGHGLYDEPTEGTPFRPDRRVMRRPGKHGYLAFEDSDKEDNTELVDGPMLGKLLVETEAAVLVLNACRSAHADTLAEDAPNVPRTADPASAADNGNADPHAQVRALGSLAQEVIDSGVGGVVAMRYNVYVVTAAQFVADLYGALAKGQPLGEAVSAGRKQLHARPRRDIGYAPRDLQDWLVPVVYEATPIALFPKPGKQPGKPLGSLRRPRKQAAPERGVLAANVPPTPDTGFFGRDATLLELDRAFDRHPVVLLHAFAGSGKTTTAAEFARWYAQTGGVIGPVLFTSFTQKITLFQALDAIGQTFGPEMAQQWQALTELADRRKLALEIMQEVPILWIWDNVEPVAGFPNGTTSDWSEGEQRELADFLRAARDTKAKFLLTSRREEAEWLGELPRRVPLPPMPMAERMQLAKALADKRGKTLHEADWRPLLQFTEGNPLTVRVLVGHALQKGLSKPEQITQFVEELQAGKAEFQDDKCQGRSQSLGASLAYGFKETFTEEEQRRLAVLAFFQGFVDVDALREMGNPKAPWHLRAVAGMDRSTWMALLDRAAEIGLLTVYGEGYYAIHPALPWFFQSLLRRYYPQEAAEEGETVEAVSRAFVEAMGELGDYYHNQYEDGNNHVIGVLTAEEANLKHARRLARELGWWSAVIGTMQGLRTLYNHTGRRAEWVALVEEIVPDFVQPQTEGPIPGQEESWGMVMEYRVRLAREARQWAEAERWQRLRLEWQRRRAAPLLELAPEALDVYQRNILRSLAASAHELGEVLREQGKTECLELYREALSLSQRIGDRPGEAAAAFNLGKAYKNVPSLRDLGQAQHWIQSSLDLTDERDRLRRAKMLGMLGSIALAQFDEDQAAGRPEQELLARLNTALNFYFQMLELLPADVVYELDIAHNQIGGIFLKAGQVDRALEHFQQSIRYAEQAGNLYSAAQTRYNVALALAHAGRLPDALAYAQAALRNYQTYGDRAADKIQLTLELIGRLGPHPPPLS